MDGVWTCYLCGVRCVGQASTSRHKRNLWKNNDDVSRCDNVLSAGNATARIPVINRPVTLWELARRAPVSWEEERRTRSTYTVTHSAEMDVTRRFRDMTAVQDDWDKYVADTKNLFSEEFWRIFLPIHHSPRVHIDNTLGAVKKVFLRERVKKISNRHENTTAEDFWDNSFLAQGFTYPPY